MKDLLDLLNACNHVHIEHNPHKAYFETVDKYVLEWGQGDERDEIQDDVFNEMVNRDTIVFIQLYPNGPGSFYTVWHYDLREAVLTALHLIGRT